MKKSKKILSVVLALVMVFSAVGATFAASAADEKTYAPKYTEEIPKERVADLVTGLDTLLASMLPGALYTNGMIDTLYSLYGLLGLKAPEAGTDYGVKDSATFAAKAKDVIKGLLGASIDLNGNKLPISSVIGLVAGPLKAPLNILDHLLNTTLKLEVGMPFEKNADGGWVITVATLPNLVDWLVKVIDTLMPSLITSVMELLPILAEESTLIEIADLVESIAPVLAIAGVSMDSLDIFYDTGIPEETAAPSEEASAVATGDTTEPVQPATKMALDLNKILALVSGIKVNDAPLGLKFSELNLNNLRGLTDTTDTFAVVFEYLYQNIFANEANRNAIVNLLPEDLRGTVEPILAQLAGAGSSLEVIATLQSMVGANPEKWAPDEDTTTPTTKPPATADTNPGTGDAALSAVAMISVAAAAAFVLTKKKHA